MYLVLDKCFLQGAKTECIRDLSTKHELIMPEILLMEILTTENEEDKRKCIAKFQHEENPVNLIPNVGTLIRYEAQNHKSCTPIERYFFNERFVLNADFILSEEQLSTLEKWKCEIYSDSLKFIEKAIVTQEWFPELKGYKPGMPITAIEKYMETVADEINFINAIYEQIFAEINKLDDLKWPDADIINQNWVIYRYLQVHLLYVLEYIKRYGFSSPDEINKTLQNFRIDIDYCVIGALADGLLTNDKTLVTLYKLLCPKKCLITLTL